MRVSQTLAALLFAAVLAQAAPPAAPSTVKVSVGELARVEITPDAAGSVGWASGGQDADLFVDELASKGGKTRLLIQAKRAGTYRVVLWTKGETDSASVDVVAGDGKPADPVKPAAVYYFAVVGSPGPVTPTVAAVMKLPAWDELRKAGHVVNYIPADELNPGLPRPAALPAVMVLKKDGDKWVDTGANKPLPATDEAIRGLLK